MPEDLKAPAAPDELTSEDPAPEAPEALEEPADEAPPHAAPPHEAPPHEAPPLQLDQHYRHPQHFWNQRDYRLSL